MKICIKKNALFTVISMCVLSTVQSKVMVMHVDHSQNPFGGKVAFRFDKEPIINYLPSVDEYKEAEKVVFLEKNIQDASTDSTKKELVFFMPLASLKQNKTKQFINQLNATKNLPYSMVVEPVSTPMEGLLCTISFNPQEVGFQLESFVSPKSEYGIAFTFYLRDKLQTVLGNHDTIKKMAFSGASDLLKKKYA